MPRTREPDLAAAVAGDYNWARQGRLEEVLGEALPARDSATLALLFYIQGVGRHVDALISNVVRSRDLDTSQLTLLFTLWAAGSRLSPTTLHRMLVQSPSGISHTLRRLEEAGLVRRVADRSDARARYVELTAKGRRTAAAAMDEIGAAIEDVFGETSVAEVRRLTDAQQSVAQILAGSAACYPVTSRPVGVRHAPGSA